MRRFSMTLMIASSAAQTTASDSAREPSAFTVPNRSGRGTTSSVRGFAPLLSPEIPQETGQSSAERGESIASAALRGASFRFRLACRRLLLCRRRFLLRRLRNRFGELAVSAVAFPDVVCGRPFLFSEDPFERVRGRRELRYPEAGERLPLVAQVSDFLTDVFFAAERHRPQCMSRGQVLRTCTRRSPSRGKVQRTCTRRSPP